MHLARASTFSELVPSLQTSHWLPRIVLNRRHLQWLQTYARENNLIIPVMAYLYAMHLYEISTMNTSMGGWERAWLDTQLCGPCVVQDLRILQAWKLSTTCANVEEQRCMISFILVRRTNLHAIVSLKHCNKVTSGTPTIQKRFIPVSAMRHSFPWCCVVLERKRPIWY